MIVTATCLAVGCALIGVVEWYVLEYGVRKLVCSVVSDPGAPIQCERPWEPTPKPWLAAAVAFGSLALVGAGRIELHGRRLRVEQLLAGR
jgi:hypothetical protein